MGKEQRDREASGQRLASHVRVGMRAEIQECLMRDEILVAIVAAIDHVHTRLPLVVNGVLAQAAEAVAEPTPHFDGHEEAPAKNHGHAHD